MPTSTGEAPGKRCGCEVAERDSSAGNPRKFGCVRAIASERDSSSAASGQGLQPAKILCLGGTHDAQVALRERFGDDVRGRRSLVAGPRPGRISASGDYVGIYADADHFAEVIDVGRLVQNERILQGMPDGVVLLDERQHDPLGQRPACANGPAATTSSARTSTTCWARPRSSAPISVRSTRRLTTGTGQRLDAPLFPEPLLARARGAGRR